ncbi:MFS transporter [Streptomyces mangrovisoli]|uniref:MFS transporter n=1 Tax=Streptomyces mangrovisoli TaxID=1428628 RepID=A0A1J4NZ57_9ACTN|nr:MFS transporter [Streptomyces mangrovisoli]OIJ67761.1 MFS transporter [Streptomyces mangrovisoli]
MTTSVPAGDFVPPPSTAGWRPYLVDLWKAPARARAALAGSLLLMLVSPSGLSAMTTYIVPAFSRDTGTRPADGILVFVTLPLLVGPVVLPFAGRLTDRLGARRVAVPAGVAYAATTALVPLCAPSVPLVAVMLILAAVCGFMASLGVVFKVVSTWLPQHKGVGFALIGVVSSLGAAVFSPVFQWLISGGGGLGWKGTYFVAAGLIAVVALPTALFLVSEPAVPTAVPTKAPPPLPGVELRKALSTRVWISITVALALAAAGTMTMRQIAVDFFGERGFSEATVSLAVSGLFTASVVGLFVGGLALDRTDRPWVVVPMLAAVPAGLLVGFLDHGSTPLLYVTMFLLGFAYGAESALGPFLIARYFGLAAFGQLQGLTLAIATLSLGLAPYLVSAAEGWTGSYTGPVLTLLVLTLAAVVLTALLPKFPPAWDTGRTPDRTTERTTDPV